MQVSGTEVTGYVVAAAVPLLPTYRMVAIIDAAVWVETERKIGFLVGALEGLRYSISVEQQAKVDEILTKFR